MDAIEELIGQQLREHPILLYMKGTPAMPQCGFSARTVEILIECGQRFAYVNILDHSSLREALPKFARWPTFPQLWVGGELIGGCDIVTEMQARGELLPLLTAAVQKGESHSV